MISLLTLPLAYSLSLAQAQDCAAEIEQKLHSEIAVPLDPAAFHRYLYHLPADIVQDQTTGKITVDLTRIKRDLIPALKSSGLNPDEINLEVDGGAKFGGRDINVPMTVLNQDHPQVTYQGGPTDRQQYVSVVLKGNGKEIHVTDRGLIEKEEFPKVSPKAYANYPEPEMRLPEAVAEETGMDPAMIKLASRIQHENTVWSVSKQTANEQLKQEFLQYGPDLDPRPVRDKAGKIMRWDVVNKKTGKVVEAAPGDIEPAGDAAFSQHRFFWDSMFVAQSRASTDPDIALGTLKYWLDAQQPDGGVGRELDYKGTPYQRSENVKFGKVTPNREYFNPPILGMAARDVARWSPATTRELLPRLIQFSQNQRQWLLKEAGVFDKNGDLLGFKWTNLGSGRDNAPRPLDEGGFDALPKYRIKQNVAPSRDKSGLAVDLLAQYKMMLDDEAEFQHQLGQFKEAAESEDQARRIAKLLNEKYYNNKLHWYVDLYPVGATGWRQSPVLTLGGFWPVKAKVAAKAQLHDMIEDNLKNPRRFGGGPFLPSVSKDNPYYVEQGAYWRGGGWPPDWTMVISALYENGFRSLASELSRRHLAAISVASHAYAGGETPAFVIEQLQPTYEEPHRNDDPAYEKKVRGMIRKTFLAMDNGSLRNPDPPAHGTVYELYGVKRNARGGAVPTFGQEIRSNGTMHPVRSDFGGWGVSPVLDAPHSVAGLDTVPAFHGSDKDLDHWLYVLLTQPEFSQFQTGKIPAFRAVGAFLKSKPHASFEEFEKILNEERTPQMNAQIKRLKQGYVEISPTFNPGKNETELKNFVYDGQGFDVKVERLANDDTIRVTVNSPKKIRIQVNRNWITTRSGSHGTDLTQDSSPILELGGRQRSVILKSGVPVSARERVPSTREVALAE